MGSASYTVALNHTHFSNYESTKAFMSMMHFCLLSWLFLLSPRGNKIENVNIFSLIFVQLNTHSITVAKQEDSVLYKSSQPERDGANAGPRVSQV